MVMPKIIIIDLQTTYFVFTSRSDYNLRTFFMVGGGVYSDKFEFAASG